MFYSLSKIEIGIWTLRYALSGSESEHSKFCWIFSFLCKTEKKIDIRRTEAFQRNLFYQTSLEKEKYGLFLGNI